MARGIDVFTGYGMSETCPILTISHLTPEMLALSPEEQAVIRCRTGCTIPLVDLWWWMVLWWSSPATGRAPEKSWCVHPGSPRDT